MLIYLVMDRVDGETKKKWNESLDFKNLPSWQDCADILEKHCQYLEGLHANHALTSEQASAEKCHFKSKRQKYAFSFSQDNSFCKQCSSSEHHILQCTQFKELEVSNKFDFVKRLDLCFLQLSVQVSFAVKLSFEIPMSNMFKKAAHAFAF